MGGIQRLSLALATPSLCLTMGLAKPARAQIPDVQISGALSVQSDYRYRGISLSDGKPVETLDLNIDHSSGLYAGGSAIGQVYDGARTLGFIEYAGFATPKLHGVSWDVGINNQNLTYYAERRYLLNYSEVYVGVIGDNLSAHIHYSPNYLRGGAAALYAEVDGSIKPADKWRLFGHIGTTAPLGLPASRRQRWDARAGVARQIGPFELQASVTATTPNPPLFTPQERTAVMVGASWFF